MLKVNNESKTEYILTEGERVSLASQAAKNFVQDKLNYIEKYANSDIDFFTGKKVDEDNIWYFNVNKNGKLFSCVYDNEHEPSDLVQKEARQLLMWRHGDNCSYVETIGDYIENNKIYKANEETEYNDCVEYLAGESMNSTYEKLELNENNKEEIRNYLLNKIGI
jgi:hypothetical protein